MVLISGGDGSSFNDAIVISDCTESEGVHQEYIELKKIFGPYKTNSQRLMEHEGKMFDVLDVELPRGKLVVYFDISAFFGKY